ncbi:hypothetical protein MNBD_GAMMA12-1486 [hydrothermal vent metagenome]|uniref:TMEM205-like domain-containing protein n=1 Tax=hydrothermal vent metagenome TaxID=652676 RepID=A0A3B0Z815_9ZZZZ
MPNLFIFQIFLVSLWNGGSLITAYLAVPVIFSTLKPKTDLAGTIAGNIFSVMSWLGLTITLVLLISFIVQGGIKSLVKRPSALVITSSLLLSINHFFIHPLVVISRAQRAGGDADAARTFAWLHGSASLIFLVISILGIWLLINLLRNPPTPQRST